MVPAVAAALLAAVTEFVTVTVTKEGKLKGGELTPEGGLKNGGEELSEGCEGNGLEGL